ncbi:hypothetical protein WOLCODRAFT_86058, partial [Wolfiporia cocos MD-104 SS10]
AWREAIKQWELPDTVTGLVLKDWPPEWFRGDMKGVLTMKCRTRQLIASEYERCSRVDTVFLEEYPEAARGIKALLRAINFKHAERDELKWHRSKNGEPHERSSTSP